MDITSWPGSAAKLFLALALSPGHSGSQTELMRRMGTSDHHTFKAALRCLAEANVVETTGGNHHLLVETTIGSGGNHQTPGGNHQPLVETPTVVFPSPVFFPNVAASARQVPDTFLEALEPEVVSPRTQCATADRRGEGQMEAVQAAFKSLFGVDLVGGAARQLLKLGGAEDVYDALEIAKGRGVAGNPFAYVKKVLEGEKAKAPTAIIGPTRQLSEDHTGEMMEYTEADREWSRKAEAALRRKGLLDE